MEHFIFFVNTCVYFGLLIYFLFYSKWKGARLAALATFVFFVSSLFSNFYFGSPLYFLLTDRKLNEVSAIALGYIFISFLIYILPLKRLDLEEPLSYPKIRNKDVLSVLAIVIGAISVIPFVENLGHVLSMSVSDFTDAYQLKRAGLIDSRSHLSSVGRFCNGIVNWFRYINPVLFFWSIARRKSKWVIIMSSFAFLNPICLGMIMGGRGALFGTMALIVLNFLLFKNSFSKETLLKVKIWGAWIIAAFAIILLAMTFDRSGNDQSFAMQQIYRYLGEGFVNFAETGWYVQTNTQGHSIINGTGSTFFRYISDYFLSRDYLALGKITHFRMYVYYTVFGDYFIDFGFVGGLFFNALLSMCFFLAVRKKTMSFSSLVLINMYVKISLTGYGCFCYMNYAEFVIFTLIVCFLCRMIEPRHKSPHGRYLCNWEK